jgi:hypothetical protein
MFSFEIPRGRIWDWLEYETGYEQLHAKREIVWWMEEQGFRLGEDWRIELRPKGGVTRDNIYYIHFNDTKTAEIFLMRWS